MPRVLVVGSINMDVVAETGTFPRLGETYVQIKPRGSAVQKQPKSSIWRFFRCSNRVRVCATRDPLPWKNRAPRYMSIWTTLCREIVHRHTERLSTVGILFPSRFHRSRRWAQERCKSRHRCLHDYLAGRRKKRTGSRGCRPSHAENRRMYGSVRRICSRLCIARCDARRPT